MNKRLLLVLFAILILVFTSCTNRNLNEASSTDKTSEDSSNHQNYMTGHCSKDNVAEFMSVLGEQELGGLSNGFVLDEEHCYNVTPVQIAEKTSAQIFKFSDSCATFIYLDGQTYLLGEWVGGYGFVNAVPCDFDHDGNADVLYTYSWGSGLHRSLVAVFNTQTMENTVIYNSADIDHPQVDLYVSTQSSLSTDIPDAEMTTYFVVYTVNIEVREDNFANIGCIVTGIAGSVESENGSPVFHLYTV